MRHTHLIASQLRRRAKLWIAAGAAWLAVGPLVHAIAPSPAEGIFVVPVMFLHLLAARHGLSLWARAKLAPELPHARAVRS